MARLRERTDRFGRMNPPAIQLCRHDNVSMVNGGGPVLDRISLLAYARLVRGWGLRSWLLGLGVLLALAYLVLGILIGVFDDEWDSTGERTFWLVLTLGGAALLAAGLWLAQRAASRMVAVALIVIGALMGAVATFWLVITAIVAIAVIVLAFLWARRPAAAT